jgi:hypothetical protein
MTGTAQYRPGLLEQDDHNIDDHRDHQKACGATRDAERQIDRSGDATGYL